MKIILHKVANMNYITCVGLKIIFYNYFEILKMHLLYIDDESLMQKLHQHYSLINVTDVEILNMHTFDYFPRYILLNF